MLLKGFNGQKEVPLLAISVPAFARLSPGEVRACSPLRPPQSHPEPNVQHAAAFGDTSQKLGLCCVTVGEAYLPQASIP